MAAAAAPVVLVVIINLRMFSRGGEIVQEVGYIIYNKRRLQS